MLHPLPPLNSLLAFEAAARYLSFTQAARELGVTPAAISHQIKGLEEFFSKSLFVRLPRQLLLTTDGALLLPIVMSCFNELRSVTVKLNELQLNKKLKVSLDTAFLASWMVTRLAEFKADLPMITLHIKDGNYPIDFTKDDVDIAVVQGDGHWFGVAAEPLFKMNFVPVCHPSLLRGKHMPLQVTDVQALPILHDTSGLVWEKWAIKNQAGQLALQQQMVLDNTHLLIQAALKGQGIVLVAEAMVSDFLADGSLVKPFDKQANLWLDYYIVCPEQNLIRHEVTAFRDWLLRLAQLDTVRGIKLAKAA